MRKFNSREKEILKMLCDIKFTDLQSLSFKLQNIFFTKNSNNALVLLTEQKKALLFLKQDIFDNIDERKKGLGEFMELFFLIDYLKTSRLINIIPNSEVYKSDFHIVKEDFSPEHDGTKIKFNNGEYYLDLLDFCIYDSKNIKVYTAIDLSKEIFEVLISDWMSFLFITEDLKDFVSNNFKTSEDKRYAINQVATWFSIGMAFLFGFYGIYKDQNNQTIRIDNQQFEIFKTELNDFIKTSIEPKLKSISIDSTNIRTMEK